MIRRKRTRLLFGFFVVAGMVLLASSPAQAQTVRYVDETAGGNNDGTSWSDAYVHLQDALDEANANPGTSYEVRLATGVYLPDADKDGDHVDDDTTETFTFREDNVRLFGGYASGGGSSRNPEANPTVLSGDIDENDTRNSAGLTVAPSDISGLNSRHVVTLVGDNGTPITADTRLDGIYITAGDSRFERGGVIEAGGLRCNVSGSNAECSPQIVRVVFQGNAAYSGGAARFTASSGATVSPHLVNVLFRSNSAGNVGSAVEFSLGDSNTTGSPSFVNTIFSGNKDSDSKTYRGGTYSGSTLTPTFVNVVFVNNDGGPLYNFGASGATNEPDIANSILWSNGGDITGNGANTTITYSIVEGGWSGNGSNNLDQDPQFVDADGPDDTAGTPDDNLRLEGPGSSGGASPAIDAGDTGALPADETDLNDDGNTTETVPIDLYGNARVQNATGTSTVDMGAFESDGSTLPVELTHMEATKKDASTIHLTWTTASEANNAGFRVQRSASDTESWATLVFVEGAGTTSEVQRYRFTDTDLPYEGETFTYRLKQVDTDGSTQYSDPIEVERGAPSSVRLRSTFPNPVRTRATVRYELPEASDVTLALYDVLGRRVSTVVDGSQEAGRKQVEVPTSSLSTGVHVVRLRVGQTVRTRKLVVVE